eukprot:4556285-Amphidinium_carterae.1
MEAAGRQPFVITEDPPLTLERPLAEHLQTVGRELDDGTMLDGGRTIMTFKHISKNMLSLAGGEGGSIQVGEGLNRPALLNFTVKYLAERSISVFTAQKTRLAPDQDVFTVGEYTICSVPAVKGHGGLMTFLHTKSFKETSQHTTHRRTQAVTTSFHGLRLAILNAHAPIGEAPEERVPRVLHHVAN